MIVVDEYVLFFKIIPVGVAIYFLLKGRGQRKRGRGGKTTKEGRWNTLYGALGSFLFFLTVLIDLQIFFENWLVRLSFNNLNGAYLLADFLLSFVFAIFVLSKKTKARMARKFRRYINGPPSLSQTRSRTNSHLSEYREDISGMPNMEKINLTVAILSMLFTFGGFIVSLVQISG